MYFRFEKLEIWQLSRIFVTNIYRMTRNFPKDELFSLTSQLRRAAISIILNIAEGSDRKSDTEFRRFLRISLGSIEEVIAGLYIALDQNFIHEQDFNSLYEESHRLTAKINALIKSFNK